MNQQSGILPDPGILPKPPDSGILPELLIPSCTSQTDRTQRNRKTGNQTAPTARSKHSRNIAASSEMHVVPPLLFAGNPASSVLPGVLPSRLRNGGAGVQVRAAPYIADTSPRDATFNKDHRWPPGVPPSTNTAHTYAESDNLRRRPGEHAGDHRSPPIRPLNPGMQDANHSSTGLPSLKDQRQKNSLADKNNVLGQDHTDLVPVEGVTVGSPLVRALVRTYTRT